MKRTVKSDGGWLKSNDIPAGRGSFGIFEQLAEENKLIVRTFLESSHDTPTLIDDPSPDAMTKKKLKDLYTSCMDEDRLDKHGTKPLTDVINALKALLEPLYIHSTRPREQDPLTHESGKDEYSDYGLTAAIAHLHSQGTQSDFWSYYRNPNLDQNEVSRGCSDSILTVIEEAIRMRCLSGSRSLAWVSLPRSLNVPSCNCRHS